MKANQKTLHRQVRSQFQGKRKIPFMSTDHELSHGRDITWTLEEACLWVASFVDWYDHRHLNSGIKFVTPHQRHSGWVVYRPATDINKSQMCTWL